MSAQELPSVPTFEARRRAIFEQEAEFERVDRSDIIGIDHILDELDYYVEYLKNFKKAQEHDAELNAGIVFNGEPGTGKTLCARYIASVSGSKFIDAQRFLNIRDTSKDIDAALIGELFRMARDYVAKNNTPVVLFFDEFESTLVSTQVVQQIKQELSGLRGKARGVFVVATTNANLNNFDPALLRDGRLGEKIYFYPPSTRARRELLRHYSQMHPCRDDIDFDSLASLLEPAAVPSTIEEIVNKAWRLCSMRAIANNEEVSKLNQEELLRALLSDLQGVPDSTELSEADYRNLATFEIGHALVARTFGHPFQLVALSHIGYGNAFRIEDFSDFGLRTLDYFLKRAITSLGGIVAKQLYGLRMHNGDTEEFDIATKAITIYLEGFKVDEEGKPFNGLSFKGLNSARSEIGTPGGLGFSSKDGSLKEIRNLLDECKKRATIILEYYKEEGVIDELYALLSKKEHLLQKDIDKYVKPESKIKEAVGDEKEATEPTHGLGQYL